MREIIRERDISDEYTRGITGDLMHWKQFVCGVGGINGNVGLI